MPILRAVLRAPTDPSNTGGVNRTPETGDKNDEDPPNAVKNEEKESTNRLRFACVMIVSILYAPTLIVGQTTIRQYIMYNLEAERNMTAAAAAASLSGKIESHMNETLVLEQEKKNDQKHGAVLNMAIILSEAIFGMAASLLIGPLTDRFGRKWAVMSSIFGAILRQSLNLLVIHLQISMWFFVMAAAIDGIFGGLGAFTLAAMTFVSDLIPSAKTRTFAVAFMTGIAAGTSGLASLGNGYLIRAYGYYYSVIWLLSSVVVSELIVVFLLKESLKVRTKSWSLAKVLKPFSIYQRNWNLLLYLTILFLTHGAVVPRNSILDLFLMDRPLNWHSVKLGTFQTINVITQWLIAMTFMKFLQRFCSNQTILAFGLFSGVVADSIMAFANTTAMVYASVSFGFFLPIVNPTIKSIMSYEVNELERGALFASTSCIEWLSNIVFSTAFNTIYEETVTEMHGTVFLFISCIIALAGCILACITFRQKKTIQISENGK